MFICAAQQTESITSAIERQFNKIEGDIMSSAEAMPESLNIKNSNFNGVRTFGGQILHLATDNILIWSAITGDSVRNDIQDVNDPKNVKTKKDVIDYLKSSFAIGRRAIASLPRKMPWKWFSSVGGNCPGSIWHFMR